MRVYRERLPTTASACPLFNTTRLTPTAPGLSARTDRNPPSITCSAVPNMRVIVVGCPLLPAATLITPTPRFYGLKHRHGALARGLNHEPLSSASRHEARSSSPDNGASIPVFNSRTAFGVLHTAHRHTHHVRFDAPSVDDACPLASAIIVAFES